MSVVVVMAMLMIMFISNDNLLDAIPGVQGCSNAMVTVKGAGVLSSKVYSV